MYKLGLREYFGEWSNYFDMLYIFGSIVNFIAQKELESQGIVCKVVMTVIFMMQIYKTFFFLKIFDTISYIVTMIFNVVVDLQVFMLFFMIMIFLFSQVFNVIGLGNPHLHDAPGGVRDNEFAKLTAWADREAAANEFEAPGVPGEEYAALDTVPFLASFMNVLRISLGDFDFGMANSLNSAENTLFWFVFLGIVLASCVVFLNFIIAEASASYELVKERLEAEKMKSRAELVSEAQFMMLKRSKTVELLPQYIIVRSADT